MTTALDLDISALVGELDAVPCESLGHDPKTPTGPLRDDGPGTHYARVTCPACGFTTIKVYCHTFTQYIAAGGPLLCNECPSWFPAHNNVTILGPVGNPT